MGPLVLDRRRILRVLLFVPALLLVLGFAAADFDGAADVPPAGEPVTVPDLIGVELTQALSELDDAGLEVDGLIVGKGAAVVEQTPGPGAVVVDGSGVELRLG